MRWVSTLSTLEPLDRALDETAAAVRRALGRQKPDLLVVHVSSAFQSEYETIGPRLQALLSPKVLMGCSGAGIIGNGQEVESAPALSLTAAVLPQVRLAPFRMSESLLPDLDASPRQWHGMIGVSPVEQPHFLIWADPFSIRTENMLMGLDYAYPKAVKVGGLASGAAQAGENVLFFNAVTYRTGAVGLALSGNIALDAVVAQGCRPIGRPLRVTRCDRNILMELDRRPPLDVLRELFSTLGERDQNLFQNALFLGLAMDPLRSHYTRGDFLVRNIVGLDADKGLLAIGALLREGQTVQFHLRDPQTAVEELDQALHAYRAQSTLPPVSGAMLFSCLGRGSHLYGRRNHDTHTFLQILGAIPVGGLFCNGEIGPSAGQTYLHGYTSCFALFRPLYVPASRRDRETAAAAVPAATLPGF